MLMYNGSMGIVSEEKRSGFTIIEVMLFLALSGFLLVGILMGTGSSIANQRYKDAVQDAVDALRNAYSFVSDTQVQLRDSGSGVCGGLTSTQYDSSNIRQAYNSGRGRTQCVVYGAVVSLQKGASLKSLLKDPFAISSRELIKVAHVTNHHPT